MKTVNIPENVVQTETHLGYFRQFYEIRSSTTTGKEAWEQLEAERAFYGYPERYSSYGSFRVCLHRYVSNKTFRKGLEYGLKFV